MDDCLDGEPEERGAGCEEPESLQVDPVSKIEEAEGRKEILGSLNSDRGGGCGGQLRSEVKRKARRDLTISTLIAECEEYVKTDEFTKDLSDDLVHLFNQSKSYDHQSSLTDWRPRSSNTESTRKPPRIPDSMRTTKISSKTEKNDRSNIPKFPVYLRSSTYDNVMSEEVEDEGIDNDYSDDSLPLHETSPALTSEGYDSAQESGEI